MTTQKEKAEAFRESSYQGLAVDSVQYLGCGECERD